MAITDKQVFNLFKRIEEILKEIEAAISHIEPLTVVKGRKSTTNLGPLISSINSMSSSLATLLTSINTDTTSIDGKDFSTETTLSSLEGKDFSTETTLATRASQTTLAAILVELGLIKGDLNDGGKHNAQWLREVEDALTSSGKGNAGWLEDILSEAQSIDQNWNLLSINQLNLAAILAAVLNNATSGRQEDQTALLTTINTSLNNIEDDIDDTLRDIETDIGNQSNLDYSYAKEFTITDISGGTLFRLIIVVGSNNSVSVDGIRADYTGAGTNVLTVCQRYVTGSGVIREFKTGMTQSAGVKLHLPDPINTNTTEHHTVPFVVQLGHELFFEWTGVAVGDILTVIVNGKCRNTTLPLDATTGTTATFTTNTIIERIT